MSCSLTILLAMLVRILLAVPVGVLFFSNFAVLPFFVRFGVALVSMLLFVYGLMILQRWVVTFRVYSILALIAASALFVACVVNVVAVDYPAPDQVSVGYNTGKTSLKPVPETTTAWGRDLPTYFLHPAFSSVEVPNNLLAHFANSPSKIKLSFTKPASALFMADGTATRSDGISVEVKVVDSLGASKIANFLISETEFLGSRWVDKDFEAPAGITDVSVLIGTGGVGSTPDYDATLVNITAASRSAWVGYVGVLLLTLWGFLVCIYCGVTAVLQLQRANLTVGVVGSIGLIFAIFSSVTAWSHLNTHFVYFWDFLNYWEKSQSLRDAALINGWRQMVMMITAAYSADYSMTPAILPALAGIALGGLSRTTFALLITCFYAVPAFVATAYLGRQLTSPSPIQKTYPLSWPLSAFPIFLCLPFFFGTVLYLMPDIGGVALLILALLVAHHLIEYISGSKGGIIVSADLVKLGVVFGFLLSAMFLFRRWYVFGAVGIVTASALILLWEFFRSAGIKRAILSRCLMASASMGVGAIPFLCWVLFNWSHDLAGHDYSNLYSSYKNTLQYDLNYFVSAFGVVPPIIAFLAFIILLNIGGNKKLIFLLVFSGTVSAILFLHVQSPGRHHFYLLMPMLGGLMSASWVTVYRRWGRRAVVVGVMVLSGIPLFTSLAGPQGGMLAPLLPSFDDWLPKQQPYAKGYNEISHWLVEPVNVHKKFCLIASSKDINQGLFSQLWQVEPFLEKTDFAQRLIQLPQVDSTDGPPSQAMAACEIFLVATPFQTHMRPGEQLNMQLVQQDILAHAGIAAALDPVPVKVFEMSPAIKLLAFQRVGDISMTEFRELVQRFLSAKEGGGVAVINN